MLYTALASLATWPTPVPTVLHPSFLEQVALVVASFGFKPLHMTISFVVIAVLWKHKARDIRLLRNGLACLFVGESFCASNYFVASGLNNNLEILHGAGMVAMGALLPYGLFAMLDDRVLRFSDPTAACVATKFCRHCWKHEKTTCALQRLFLFVGPAMAVVSLIPLTVPIEPFSASFRIFDTDVYQEVNAVRQISELRICPAIAVAAFISTWFFLIPSGPGSRASQLLFFAGIGFASYSLFRLFLFRTFLFSPAWASIWEETTELLMILGVTLVLWFFRRQLGLFDRKSQGA